MRYTGYIIVLTTKDFIQKAKELHGNQYDYSKTVYIKSHEKVAIKCKKHGTFFQKPNGHLNGKGCSLCADNLAHTTKDFVQKATLIHGNTYDYTAVIYKNAKQKVTIICRTHGKFEQKPNKHLSGDGCPACSQYKKLDINDFIKRAQTVHGHKYDYSLTVYNGIKNPVEIECHKHGKFNQKAESHLAGNGCRACGGCLRLSTEDFIANAKKTHGDKYSYTTSVYKNAKTKIKIDCYLHGHFKQLPNDHIRGRGCPQCIKKNHSTLCVKWLSSLEVAHGIHIHHAENGGEFKIPGTRLHADGYCEETNTIYEFYGDYWHGNPSVYNNETVMKNGKTVECLNKTLKTREDKIRALGYNLVTIWESDWNKFNS